MSPDVVALIVELPPEDSSVEVRHPFRLGINRQR